jgi:hypothetical protein
MRSEGQRQDVAFLALAVAVMAIALALFVGMKSVQKRQPEEPAAEPAVEVAAAEPVVEEPQETDGRDPFKVQGGAAGSPAGGATVASHSLKLVGIIMEQGDRPMAIIRSASGRHYARVGARVGAYTVASIGPNEVVLEGESDRISLVMRDPATPD